MAAAYYLLICILHVKIPLDIRELSTMIYQKLLIVVREAVSVIPFKTMATSSHNYTSVRFLHKIF